MFIDRAGLRVSNLEGMILFYQQVFGLAAMSRTEQDAVLGVGGNRLLELVRDPGGTPAPASAAGLYHLAFEMPARRDLARWIVHAAMRHFQVSGLADHRVTLPFGRRSCLAGSPPAARCLASQKVVPPVLRLIPCLERGMCPPA
jgi:catechol-2,3-dioxygenase